MSEQNKKSFPKIEKKISGFQTSENKHTNAKIALGLAMGATLLAGGHHDANAANPGNPGQATVAISTSGYTCEISATPSTGSVHGSGLVNGHFSSTTSITATASLGACNHTSSGSGSGGGGGWC